MKEAGRGNGAIWLVALILVMAIGTGGAFGWLAHVRHQRLLSNETSASAALKEICMAEADFRANDRDRNGVKDFWTADIGGLFRYGLIRRDLLTADAKPLTAGSPATPHHGYLFAALERDDSVTPPEPYRQETDKKSGTVHHEWKFGFVAFPAEQDVTGKHVYVVNENNTIFRCNTNGVVPKNWPSDDELRRNWVSIW